MKNHLIFIFSLIVTNTFAQFGTEQVITTSANTNSVYACDIDGDGDNDIVSTYHYGKISWYENTDGNGSFNIIHQLDSNISFVFDVFSEDFDGDGDLDLLAITFDYKDTNYLVWFENLDGIGNFGAQQIITTNISQGRSVYATDIDNDGDIDVLSASGNDNKIAWYENLDGLGNFGTQQIISTNHNHPRDVYAADIDNDGDMDILAASLGGKIVWYENLDGLGDFRTQQIISMGTDGPQFVRTADFDNDGDLDVLSAFFGDNKVAWYENLDGLGSFGTQQIITISANYVREAHPFDMDGDGDMDVISASQSDSKLAWYENTNGLGSFGSQQIISITNEGVDTTFASDLDNDGDLDIICGSHSLPSSGNVIKISWYENLTPLSVNQQVKNNFTIYPTPTLGIVNVKSEIEIFKIQIYSNLGKLIIENFNENKIDISKLSKGIYYCKIKDLNGNLEIKKIIKN